MNYGELIERQQSLNSLEANRQQRKREEEQKAADESKHDRRSKRTRVDSSQQRPTVPLYSLVWYSHRQLLEGALFTGEASHVAQFSAQRCKLLRVFYSTSWCALAEVVARERYPLEVAFDLFKCFLLLEFGADKANFIRPQWKKLRKEFGEDTWVGQRRKFQQEVDVSAHQTRCSHCVPRYEWSGWLNEQVEETPEALVVLHPILVYHAQLQHPLLKRRANELARDRLIRELYHRLVEPVDDLQTGQREYGRERADSRGQLQTVGKEAHTLVAAFEENAPRDCDANVADFQRYDMKILMRIK